MFEYGMKYVIKVVLGDFVGNNVVWLFLLSFWVWWGCLNGPVKGCKKKKKQEQDIKHEYCADSHPFFFLTCHVISGGVVNMEESS